jgi:lysozyme
MNIEDLLIREEGFRSHAYKDHLGYWTIGFGRMIDQRLGGGISRNEALVLLLNDIDNIRVKLDDKIPWWRFLNEDRQAVLLSMAYQMGVNGLMKFRRTLAHMKEGDYKKAANGMRASLWARQTPGRAERHARAMEEGAFR